MSQPRPAAPRGHPLLSAPCPVPLQYSQSVKKTWAALYLEVGGSLKSLMREWMDCKRHERLGWAGRPRIAAPKAQGAAPCAPRRLGTVTRARVPPWAQILLLLLPPAPAHLLGGRDEIHGLQAGQRLPALVDVFHDWGGKHRGHAGGGGTSCQPPGAPDISLATRPRPCGSRGCPQPTPALCHPAGGTWVLGKVPGRGAMDLCACCCAVAALVHPRVPALRGGHLGVMLCLGTWWYPGDKPPTPSTSRGTASVLLLSERRRQRFIGLG